MASTRQRQVIGFAAFTLFLSSVATSNWMAGGFGTECIPNGPCLVPVAPGLMAPSGVVLVGVSLVLRDVIQRCLGMAPSFIAMLGGAMVSVVIAVQDVVVASAAAFLLGELADLLSFTLLQRRGLVLAVVVSSFVGLIVDSAVFIHMAFESLEHLPSLIVGKTWGVLLSIPFVQLLRRYMPPIAPPIVG